MGVAFHETRMGMRFYEVVAPRIADELANLNNNLSALVALLRERRHTESGVPVPIPTPARGEPR